MNIAKLKKYFSLNPLSLLGYVSFLFWTCAIFRHIQYIKLVRSTGDDFITYMFEIFLFNALIINVVIFLLLIIYAYIEKSEIAEIEKFEEFNPIYFKGKINDAFFLIGLILSVLSFFLILYLIF